MLKFETLQADLEADLKELAVLRKGLQADQKALAELGKKMAMAHDAILMIESKINEIQARLVLLRKSGSGKKK